MLELNGRVKGDLDGELTCFPSKGCSMVDYTLMSSNLFECIVRFSIGQHDQFTHLPQIFIIKVKNVNIVKEPVAEAVTDHSKKRVRFKWTDYSYQKLIESDYIPVFLGTYRKLRY